MYTTGRGTEGYGTIIPAIIEWERENRCIEEIKLIGTNGSRLKESMQKIKSVFNKTGIKIKTKTYPKNNLEDIDCYKKVLKNSKNISCAVVAVPDHLHEKRLM